MIKHSEKPLKNSIQSTTSKRRLQKGLKLRSPNPVMMRKGKRRGRRMTMRKKINSTSSVNSKICKSMNGCRGLPESK